MMSMTFSAGQIVGEYRVEGLLGQGGLGAVYKATHLISQRSEAMKVLLPEQMGTPDMMERFRREIQLLATLNHPNIAALHHAFYLENQLIMIMELVEGEDLRSLSRRTRIPLPLLIEAASQVLAALDYAHARGITHRDIKPANIMVSPAGLVKVLDFGIAISQKSTELTAAGSLIGSPTHMSPEQIRGEKATAQSDIYSLGVTLYELIAGQLPLNGETTYELMMAHMQVIPIPLRELRGDIPASLSNAIARALEKDPAKRFASAGEFLAAMRAQEAPVGTDAVTMAPAASWQRVSTDDLRRPNTAPATLPLEPLTKHLASFIGPIAKIVVNRLAKQYGDLDRIYAEAAKQIDGDAERQRFLRTRPR
jgi:serine/threonine-protein kinase